MADQNIEQLFDQVDYSAANELAQSIAREIGFKVGQKIYRIQNLAVAYLKRRNNEQSIYTVLAAFNRDMIDENEAIVRIAEIIEFKTLDKKEENVN